ncbi:PRC-barrel domain-containing protein, partial [Streptomyces cavourensis]|nr:PRC-barrel domain-containing protein [Streptomyces cavourensis]
MGAADGFTDSGELDGLTVYDNEGEKVGSVGRVYVDDDTGKPDWVTVKTGLFGMKESFVPLAGARRVGSDLHVSHSKDTVKEAPRVDADAHLSVAEEEELYRHYGMTRKAGNLGGDAKDTGTGTGADARTVAGTGAMGAAGAGAAGTARGTGTLGVRRARVADRAVDLLHL